MKTKKTNLRCRIFGHEFNTNYYGRFNPDWGALDGIGRDHRMVERQCIWCHQWIKTCLIHLPSQGD